MFDRKINQKGSAMVFVIIIFLVISILAASMAAIFSANLKQTKNQQDSLEAYYLSYSGALIAYEALLANNSAKLNQIRNNGSTLSTGPKSMGRGSVSVIARMSTDPNFDGWIKITSTAILDRNGSRYVRNLYFDSANPLEILWTSN